MKNVLVKLCVGRINKKMSTMGAIFRARVICCCEWLAKCDNSSVLLCSKKSCHRNYYKVTDIQLWAFLPSMGLVSHRTDALFFFSFFFCLGKGKFLNAKNKVLAQFLRTAIVGPQRIRMLILLSDWWKSLHLLGLWSPVKMSASFQGTSIFKKNDWAENQSYYSTCLENTQTLFKLRWLRWNIWGLCYSNRIQVFCGSAVVLLYIC